MSEGERRKRAAAIFWPAFIVFLLLIPVAASVVLVRVATGDPSFAVEEDYYEKARDWDAEMEQRGVNERLGWRVELRAAAVAGRRVILTARLFDEAGRPVGAEQVRLEAFPVARASQVERVELTPTPEGSWDATLPLHHAGLWEFRFEALARGERFTETIRRELRLDGSPS